MAALSIVGPKRLITIDIGWTLSKKNIKNLHFVIFEVA